MFFLALLSLVFLALFLSVVLVVRSNQSLLFDRRSADPMKEQFEFTRKTIRPLT
jgi:hypothetical protein